MQPNEETNGKKNSNQTVELLTRLDERVKNINNSLKKLEEQSGKISRFQSTLSYKINAIESDLENKESAILALEEQDLQSEINDLKLKIQSIDVRIGNNDNRWLLIFDSAWKIGLMLISSFILYKLGWQPPVAP